MSHSLRHVSYRHDNLGMESPIESKLVLARAKTPLFLKKEDT